MVALGSSPQNGSSPRRSAWEHEPVHERTQRNERARHRRTRSLRPRGRHRVRYGNARWLVPAGLAVVILLIVAVALMITDATTSAAYLTPVR